MRGSRAAVMRPNVLLLTEESGLFNSVWFSTLKNSARYFRRRRSRMVNTLCAETSTLKRPGHGASCPDVVGIDGVDAAEVGQVGDLVDGLGEGVIGAHGEAARAALFHRDLERIVNGIAAGDILDQLLEVLVGAALALVGGCGARPGEGRIDVAVVSEVRALRSDITRADKHCARQLVLDGQVPA